MLKNIEIPMIFSKNTYLPYEFFQNTNIDTETFFCIPSICMYLQATRGKFLQDLALNKYMFYKKVMHYTTYN